MNNNKHGQRSEVTRGAKSLWIYVAVLFVAALLLIAITTVTQAKLVSGGGTFELLGTFTETAQRNVAQLSEYNVELTSEKHRLEAELMAKGAELSTVKSAQTLMSRLYVAYEAGDEETAQSLIRGATQAQLDIVETNLPGLLGKINQMGAQPDDDTQQNLPEQ